MFFLKAVIVGEDKAIGFCTLFESYRSVQASKVFILNDLYVLKIYRHYGCGTQLLGAAIALAEREGIKFLKLETGKDNIAAQGVYVKNGWNCQILFLIISTFLTITAK